MVTREDLTSEIQLRSSGLLPSHVDEADKTESEGGACVIITESIERWLLGCPGLNYIEIVSGKKRALFVSVQD